MAYLDQVLQVANLNLTDEQKTSIQLNIELSIRKNLIEEYKSMYPVWNDGKNWRTYYFDENQKKRFLKNKKEEDLNNKIVEYMKNRQENPSFHELYQEWIKDKAEVDHLEKSTINRYDRQYNQVLSELGKKHIKSFTPEYIERFMKQVVWEKELRAKAYSNARTILKGVLKVAKRKGFIQFSINDTFEMIEIPNKFFKKSKKKDDELVFMDREVEKLFEYFDNKTLDLKDLGIMLLFYTGMRPGELSALCFEDIAENQIYIRRTEVRYKTESGSKYVYEVQMHAKTEAGERELGIPVHAQWIINEIRKLNPNGYYVFEQNGERIKTCSFDSRLRDICKKLKIKEKSLNKFRKTYATILHDSGVDDTVIMSQMGHKEITTTRRHYVNNRTSAERTVQVMNEVFENMAIKKISQA